MNNEIWKTIEGYPNYMVSNLGRVKSCKRTIMRNNGHPQTINEKILKSCNDGGSGYLRVNLYKEGKEKKYYIHRLVAQAFLDNPNNLSQVNHIDEDKTNNCVENLEYCDVSYNINYGTRNERVSKTKSIPILQFTREMEFIKRWESATQVERELGIDQGNICMCCKGKIKTCGGYVWGYEKDYEKIPFKVFDLTIYQRNTATSKD